MNLSASQETSTKDEPADKTMDSTWSIFVGIYIKIITISTY